MEILEEHYFASFVPDIIIKYIIENTNYSLPYKMEHNGVALFAIISGCDLLIDKFLYSDISGAEELSEIFNNFFGPIFAEVITASGDIIKFTGNSLLCLWTAENNSDLSDKVDSAIKCALSITSQYGLINTCIESKLSIKFGISVGKFYFILAGKLNNFIDLMITGPAILTTQDAECLCFPSEIILTNVAWKTLHHHQSTYQVIYLKEEKYVKILFY